MQEDAGGPEAVVAAPKATGATKRIAQDMDAALGRAELSRLVSGASAERAIQAQREAAAQERAERQRQLRTVPAAQAPEASPASMTPLAEDPNPSSQLPFTQSQAASEVLLGSQGPQEAPLLRAKPVPGPAAGPAAPGPGPGGETALSEGQREGPAGAQGQETPGERGAQGDSEQGQAGPRGERDGGGAARPWREPGGLLEGLVNEGEGEGEEEEEEDDDAAEVFSDVDDTEVSWCMRWCLCCTGALLCTKLPLPVPADVPGS